MIEAEGGSTGSLLLYTKCDLNLSTGTLCKGEESSKEGKEAREVAEDEDKGKKH